MMELHSIRHDNLRRIMQEIKDVEGDAPLETYHSLFREMRHSCLLTPANVNGDKVNVIYAKIEDESFGALFTDMDEFRKVFPDFDVEAHSFDFSQYVEMLEKGNLRGFFINMSGEDFIFPREFVKYLGDMPEMTYSHEDSYTSDDLKSLKDSMDNSDLEDFLNDPANIGRYEELFDKISDSTILTLRLSRENLNAMAEDGVISMKETGPLGFLYTDNGGGMYATAFTSDDKIRTIPTALNKYSQLINFSQMTNYVLSDDLDGIIINPNEENVLLTREVLLEYSPLLEMMCNDSRLNSAIFYLFTMEEA